MCLLPLGEPPVRLPYCEDVFAVPDRWCPIKATVVPAILHRWSIVGVLLELTITVVGDCRYRDVAGLGGYLLRGR